MKPQICIMSIKYNVKERDKICILKKYITQKLHYLPITFEQLVIYSSVLPHKEEVLRVIIQTKQLNNIHKFPKTRRILEIGNKHGNPHTTNTIEFYGSFSSIETLQVMINLSSQEAINAYMYSLPYNEIPSN